MKYFVRIFFICFFVLACGSSDVGAADMLSGSVRLTDSAPNAPANHIITATLTNSVPPGGKVVITPTEGEFSILNTFDYTDIDFLYATSADVFTQRLLAPAPSATEDGVSVSGLISTTSTSSVITITLNATEGLSAGNQIQVRIGTNATYQHTGNVQYVNPSSVGSFDYVIETQDVLNNRINIKEMLAVIIQPITTSLYYVDVTPPFRFNGAPMGNLAPNTTNVEVTFRTNELALCKFATTSDVSFADMPDFFTVATTSTHSRNFVTVNGEAYNIYIRCRDYADNVNIDDYLIAFAIAAQPGAGAIAGDTGGGTGENTGGTGGTGSGTGTGGTSSGSGSSSGGGGGGGGGGSSPISGGTPFPTTYASVRLVGIGFPFSTISVIQDGVLRENVSTPVGSNGEFNILVSDLTRGTHTFGVYATGPNGIASSKYNSTLTVIGNTVSSVTDIHIPPSITTDKVTYTAGESVVISGYAPAESVVDVWYHQQKSVVLDNDIVKRQVAADANGLFTTTISTSGNPNGTYQIKARWSTATQKTSDFSAYKHVGVGVAPAPEATEGLIGDLNVDGKVNIVDFSILLFHWGSDGSQSNPTADLNNDARVNLTDFSIMIFHWTG